MAATGLFFYRFEIYLCLADRVGKPVDLDKLNDLKNEIVAHFGGLTMTSIFGNPVYDGFWKSPKSRKVARDKNSIFTVLAPQSEDSISFFLSRREKWEVSLNYEKLLITAHELQVL
ncbi:MAG: hypothetical protein WCC04_20785 [Terriglobales bacterium]